MLYRDVRKRKAGKVVVQEEIDLSSGAVRSVTANGFGYHFNQKNKNGVHYLVCRYRMPPHRCPARGKMDAETCTFYRVGEHTCHL